MKTTHTKAESGNSQHTPGPWVIMPAPDGELDLKGNNGNTLITVFPNLAKIDGVAYTPSEQDAANLRLIAAAPELLAALEGLLDQADMGNVDEETQPFVDAARAAIAKATGK